MQNRYDEAIADYSGVLKLDPGNIHAYHNRGISYDKLGAILYSCPYSSDLYDKKNDMCHSSNDSYNIPTDARHILIVST